MNYGTNRRLSITLAAVLFLAAASLLAASPPAQMRGTHGGRGPAPAPRGGLGRPFRPGGRAGFFGFGPRSRSFFPDWGSIALPYYPGYDYGDYGEPPMPPQGPPPESFAQPPAPAPPPPQPPAQPLVIEYQGDAWVRVENLSEAQARPASAPDAEPERELPPAVLVYRDGHQEEVRGYTIMGAIIYASANYWSTGSWTKQVPIAQLDVPATLKLNQERGGKFSLPSGPNEVVMRP